jgi:predicted regulator of Ras-like GTPase activity (Roadblock/LC7/MglB family)
MACFPCNAASNAVARSNASDVLTEKLKTIMLQIPDAVYICVLTYEGSLESIVERGDAPGKDIIAAIATINNASKRFLKIFGLESCNSLHVSGDYYAFSIYRITEYHFLVLTHPLDPTIAIVDYTTLDSIIKPFLDDIHRWIGK